MLDFRIIFRIKSDAIKSMSSDSDGDEIKSSSKKAVFFLSFYLIPILGASIVAWKDVRLEDLESYIGTGIAIFTGLFFSLLLSIGSKIKSEKENPDVDVANFARYKNNMRQIASIILFVIFLGVMIFIIMLINSLTMRFEWCYLETILTMVAVYFLIQFLVSIFFIIQRFYHVVFDEINNII